MKKKILSAFFVVALALPMVTGCNKKNKSLQKAASTESSQTQKKIKVGISLQSLKNVYWGGVMEKLAAMLKEKGWEYTIIDCENNSAIQISQVENFVTSGCNLIMVHPSDASALENVSKDAVNAGVKVMCWDDPMRNTTVNWVLDNTEVGKEIAKTASVFINKYYTPDNKAKVVVIGNAATKPLFDRANGIKEGLAKYCDNNYIIVAEADGLEVNQAQSNVETILSAHPDAKVFVCVGAGSMIGANEALLQHYGGRGKIPEDVGVISTDVTAQQLNSLKAGNEAVRAILGFEGSNTDTAAACFKMFERIMNGEDFSGNNHNVQRGTNPITLDNIDQILSGM